MFERMTEISLAFTFIELRYHPPRAHHCCLPQTFGYSRSNVSTAQIVERERAIGSARRILWQALLGGELRRQHIEAVAHHFGAPTRWCAANQLIAEVSYTHQSILESFDCLCHPPATVIQVGEGLGRIDAHIRKRRHAQSSAGRHIPDQPYRRGLAPTVAIGSVGEIGGGRRHDRLCVARAHEAARRRQAGSRMPAHGRGDGALQQRRHQPSRGIDPVEGTRPRLPGRRNCSNSRWRSVPTGSSTSYSNRSTAGRNRAKASTCLRATPTIDSIRRSGSALSQSQTPPQRLARALETPTARQSMPEVSDSNPSSLPSETAQ